MNQRTIHGSSLSKAIHGIVAARVVACWRRDITLPGGRGLEIDLLVLRSASVCGDGIHANAAAGAIWLRGDSEVLPG
ncbi:hypothetical protein O5541_02960 [Escherichia coli]|nr:hypothetical protein [Escherichia coli]